MIDHDIMRLYISVHYSHTVAKVKRLKLEYLTTDYYKNLVDVVSAIEVCEFRIEGFIINVVDMFKDLLD